MSKTRGNTITVRQLDESVIKAIRIRAAHSGRSMEAEMRAILAAAAAENPCEIGRLREGSSAWPRLNASTSLEPSTP